MMVPGLACTANSATTSRTCSSLSTVTLMMSAFGNIGDAVGQRGAALASGVMASTRTSKTVDRPASQVIAWPSGAHVAQADVPSFSSSGAVIVDSLMTG